MGEAAVRATRLRVALGEGERRREVLRGIDLELARGEVVALMGRNGAGKSTLLRTLAGVLEPERGSVEAPGGVALLPQRPDDMLVRERVDAELPGEAGLKALRAQGLEGAIERDPRDLSGGERQRLALAIAVAGRDSGADVPGAVLLDEPTRGMDRERKRDLVRLCRELSAAGAAVVVATHDVELAAALATRVLLMGEGELVADGPPTELLAGGWYFSTEVARVLGDAGAVTPEQGARVLRGRIAAASNAAQAVSPRGPEATG